MAVWPTAGNHHRDQHRAPDPDTQRRAVRQRRLAINESTVILTAPPCLSLLKHLVEVTGGCSSRMTVSSGASVALIADFLSSRRGASTARLSGRMNTFDAVAEAVNLLTPPLHPY